MKTKRNPNQPTLPGLAPPLPPRPASATWHASHDREGQPPAAGLPARERCRACGVASDGELAARLCPLPCVGHPWGSLEEARALAAEDARWELCMTRAEFVGALVAHARNDMADGCAK